MKQFVLVFLMGVSSIMLASAQEFLPARVIMNDLSEKGGLVWDGTDLEINKEVKFKMSTDAPSETILPSAIYSIQFENGRWFSRKVIWSEERKDSMAVLLKNIVQGHVQVFTYPVKNKSRYFLQKDMKLVSYKPKASWGLLRIFFEDCPALTTEEYLKKIKNDERSVSAVLEYNRCSPGKIGLSEYKSQQGYLSINGGISLLALLDSKSNRYHYSYRAFITKGIVDPDRRRNLSFEQGLMLGLDSYDYDVSSVYQGITTTHVQTINRQYFAVLPLIARFKKEYLKSGIYFRIGLGVEIGRAAYQYSELGPYPNYGNLHYNSTEYAILPVLLGSIGYELKVGQANSINIEAGTLGFNVGYLFRSTEGAGRIRR